MGDGPVQIVGEKLDKNNFQSWKYKMQSFLKGKGLWSLVSGDEVEPSMQVPNPTPAQVQAHRLWTERANKVLHYFAICVSDAMLCHIQNVDNPHDAWDTLVRMYDTNTQARKLQLKQKLHSVVRNNRSIQDYVQEIKGLGDALASINSPVEDSDLVAIALNGLGREYKNFDTSIAVRGGDPPDFDELCSLLITEELKLGLGTSSSTGGHARDQAFYSRGARGRGRSYMRGRGTGRGWQDRPPQQQQNAQQFHGARGGRYSYTPARGRAGARGGRWQQGAQTNANVECHYCGKFGHMARDCYKKQNDTRGGRVHGNYASSSNEGHVDHLFAMKHVMGAMSSQKDIDDTWYMDSGASNHMTCHGEWFDKMMPTQSQGYVVTGDDTQHAITHTGSVPLRMHDGKVKSMSDVLYVPSITKNLASVGQMVEQGLQVRFNKHGCFVEDFKNGCRLIAKGQKDGRLFKLDAGIPELKSAMFSKDQGVVPDVDIWHKRIGHVNIQKLKSMQAKGIVGGLPRFKYDGSNHVCDACQFGKQARLPFRKDTQVSRYPLELIHSDIWGPAQTPTINGCRYYVTFIDDFSRKTWIYFLKAKSEAFDKFKEFKTFVEKQYGTWIKCLRTDGGGEYLSREFDAFLREHGIRRQVTCAYTPQQNGVAERKNRVISEVARAMLNEKSMPNYFWAEACATAVYLLNRTPTAAIHESTPEMRLTGFRPDVSHLKVFGCIAYVHIPDERRRKLDPKAEKCVFIGYALDRKAYKCFNPVTKQVVISRDVIFDELASWYKDSDHSMVVDDIDSQVQVNLPTMESSTSMSGPTETSSGDASVRPWTGRLQRDDASTSTSKVVDKGKQKVEGGYDSSSSESLDEELGIPTLRTPGVRQNRYVPPHERAHGGAHSDPQVLRRSQRVKYPVQRLSYNGYAMHYAYMTSMIKNVEPTSFKGAIGTHAWDKAMDEEMDALSKNDTWDLVELPQGKNVIGCKWVYKVKCKADGSIERHKARLVAKGYAQTYGLDYDETFSPVAKMATVRSIIALAAQKGWNLHQMDVKNAFLNGDLEEEVYMEQPEGYVHPKYPSYVCKLKKALYGLKQAPRAWSDKISKYLVSIGFEVGAADSSLYVKKTVHGLVIIVIYVDDLILTGDHIAGIDEVRASLCTEFDMKDLGELRFFLGIEVVKTGHGIWLVQRQYALDMLAKYGMTACKPMSTPLEQNMKLRADLGDEVEDVTMYRKMVGSLIYMTITRPDLSYAVGLVSQFMQSPRKPHLDAVRRIMRYVKTTVHYGLFYEHGTPMHVYGYTDADWAGSAYDRRSTSGYVFSLGSGAVSWSSKKQPTVALSTTEAEYRGAAIAACEVMWLKKLLGDIGEQNDMSVVIHCDNMSSIQLASNPVYHARTKHIEVHYHFIREKVLDGHVDLTYVQTDEQIADVFTKALGKDKFEYFRTRLGVLEMEMSSLRGSVETSSSCPAGTAGG